MKIEVRCYAGYRGYERPEMFVIGGRTIEVVQILDRWYDPDHSWFKVRGDDGNMYILRYNQQNDSWELSFFKSGCMI